MHCECAGSFSFPNVPPHAELEYEVELVDFDPADEVSSRSDFSMLQHWVGSHADGARVCMRFLMLQCR